MRQTADGIGAAALEKESRLIALIHSYGDLGVAYSGGVDSSYLSDVAHETLGNRARLRVREPVPYGDEPPPAALAVAPADEASAASEPSLCVAAMFNLAQSPEQEVHGEFLSELKAAVERSGGDSSLLVLLDEDAYRERLGESAARDDAAGEGRLVERRGAWQRLARECELELVSLWSGAPRASQDERLGALRAGLWPAGPREAA